MYLCKHLKEKYSVVAPPANLVSFEEVSKAIRDYCCELIDQGKDAVEVTEFNAEILKKIMEMCNERPT